MSYIYNTIFNVSITINQFNTTNTNSTLSPLIVTVITVTGLSKDRAIS